MDGEKSSFKQEIKPKFNHEAILHEAITGIFPRGGRLRLRLYYGRAALPPLENSQPVWRTRSITPSTALSITLRFWRIMPRRRTVTRKSLGESERKGIALPRL
jgi:hypothetical protein